MYQINADEFNQAIQEKLTKIEVDFPVSNDLLTFMRKALDYASTLALGLKGSDMKKIEDKVSGHEKLNYFDYAILSNNLEIRTKKEMADITRGSIYDYYMVVSELERNADLMNIKAKIVHEETMKEFVNKNNKRLANPEQNGFKAIKGQA